MLAKLRKKVEASASKTTNLREEVEESNLTTKVLNKRALRMIEITLQLNAMKDSSKVLEHLTGGLLETLSAHDKENVAVAMSSIEYLVMLNTEETASYFQVYRHILEDSGNQILERDLDSVTKATALKGLLDIFLFLKDLDINGIDFEEENPCSDIFNGTGRLMSEILFQDYLYHEHPR